jgi:hypothetical protein
MGFITFASLYRPLYYNLIDNSYGRRLGYSLVPYVLALLIIPSITYIKNAYYPSATDQTHLIHEQYDDIPKENEALGAVSIPSRYVANGFLEVFIPYLARLNDPAIEANHPDLEPAKFTGFKLQGAANVGQVNNPKVNRDSLLLALSELHRLYLDDSLVQDPVWQFYTHPTRKMPGLLTILDLDGWSRGRHVLRVETYSYSNLVFLPSDSLQWRPMGRIPFWLE